MTIAIGVELTLVLYMTIPSIRNQIQSGIQFAIRTIFTVKPRFDGPRPYGLRILRTVSTELTFCLVSRVSGESRVSHASSICSRPQSWIRACTPTLATYMTMCFSPRFYGLSPNPDSPFSHLYGREMSLESRVYCIFKICKPK